MSSYGGSDDGLAASISIDADLADVMDMLSDIKMGIDSVRGDMDREERMERQKRRHEHEDVLSTIEKDVRYLRSAVRQADVELDFIQKRLESYRSGNPKGHTIEELSNECGTLQLQLPALRNMHTNLSRWISEQRRILVADGTMTDLLSLVDHENRQLTVPDMIAQLGGIEAATQELIDELNSLAVQEVEVEMFTCPICMEDLPIDDVFCISECEHKMCLQCARHMVQEDLKCGKFPLVCPQCKGSACKRCPSRRYPSQVFENPNEGFCMLQDSDLDLVLEGEEKIRYNRILMDFVVNTNEHMVRCPNPECRAVFEIDDAQDHCTCICCNHQWCAKCHVDWHKGSTCEQYRQWQKENEKADDLFEEMKRKGEVKKCPNCQKFGTKDDPASCNAITCLHCRKYFCWLCEKPINLRDKHAHFAEEGPCKAKLFEGCAGH
ncbi:unnamed protein product [Ostreobium quekettii]|uniref:RING-type domain-containing protein n=1 Tax=Ostreobium quekettii TaxID=121088 RepID=A0A8S1IY12_9CHLO|nr:unnamed protein product [Ostreobium quekettii]